MNDVLREPQMLFADIDQDDTEYDELESIDDVSNEYEEDDVSVDSSNEIEYVELKQSVANAIQTSKTNREDKHEFYSEMLEKAHARLVEANCQSIGLYFDVLLEKLLCELKLISRTSVKEGSLFHLFDYPYDSFAEIAQKCDSYKAIKSMQSQLSEYDDFPRDFDFVSRILDEVEEYYIAQEEISDTKAVVIYDKQFSDEANLLCSNLTKADCVYNSFDISKNTTYSDSELLSELHNASSIVLFCDDVKNVKSTFRAKQINHIIESDKVCKKSVLYITGDSTIGEQNIISLKSEDWQEAAVKNISKQIKSAVPKDEFARMLAEASYFDKKLKNYKTIGSIPQSKIRIHWNRLEKLGEKYGKSHDKEIKNVLTYYPASEFGKRLDELQSNGQNINQIISDIQNLDRTIRESIKRGEHEGVAKSDYEFNVKQLLRGIDRLKTKYDIPVEFDKYYYHGTEYQQCKVQLTDEKLIEQFIKRHGNEYEKKRKYQLADEKFNEGIELFKQNKFRESKEKYIEAANLGHYEAHFKLGNIENKKGNKQAALNHYKQAAENGHNKACIELGKHCCTLAKQDVENKDKYIAEALEWYKRAISLSKQKPFDACIWLANYYMRERDYEKARNYYETALMDKKSKAKIYDNLIHKTDRFAFRVPYQMLALGEYSLALKWLDIDERELREYWENTEHKNIDQWQLEANIKEAKELVEKCNTKIFEESLKKYVEDSKKDPDSYKPENILKGLDNMPNYKKHILSMAEFCFKNGMLEEYAVLCENYLENNFDFEIVKKLVEYYLSKNNVSNAAGHIQNAKEYFSNDESKVRIMLDHCFTACPDTLQHIFWSEAFEKLIADRELTESDIEYCEKCCVRALSITTQEKIADYYFNNGRFEDGMTLYVLIYDYTKDSAWVRKIADTYWQNNSKSLAIDWYKKTVDEDEEDLSAATRLILYYLNQGDNENAATYIQKYSNYFVNDEDKVRFMIEHCFTACPGTLQHIFWIKEFEKFIADKTLTASDIEYCEKCHIESFAPQTQERIADFYIKNGRFEDGVALCTRIYNSNKSISLAKTIADEYWKNDKKALAVEWYEKYSKLRPNKAIISRLVNYFLNTKVNSVKAIKWINAGQTFFVSDEKIVTYMLDYYKSRHYESSPNHIFWSKAYEKFIAGKELTASDIYYCEKCHIESFAPQTQMRIADFYIKNGRFEDGMALYSGIYNSTKDIFLSRKIADEYWNSDKKSLAVEWYEKSLGEVGEHEVVSKLVDYYLSNGDKDKAATHIQSSSEHYANDEDKVRFMLAYCYDNCPESAQHYFWSGEFKKFIENKELTLSDAEYCEKCHTMAIPYRVLTKLGDVCYKNSNPQLACKWYLKHVTYQKQYQFAKEQGDAFWKDGYKEEAVLLYEFYAQNVSRTTVVPKILGDYYRDIDPAKAKTWYGIVLENTKSESPRYDEFELTMIELCEKTDDKANAAVLCLQVGDKLYKNGQIDAAIVQYEKCSVYGSYSSVEQILGDYHYGKNDLDRAYMHYKKMYDISPSQCSEKNLRMIRDLSQTLLDKTSDDAKKKEYLTNIMEYTKLIAEKLYYKGDVSEACKEYLKYENPNFTVKNYRHIITYYMKQDKLGEAYDVYQKYLNNKMDDDIIWDIGDAYLKKKAKDLAIKCYENYCNCEKNQTSKSYIDKVESLIELYGSGDVQKCQNAYKNIGDAYSKNRNHEEALKAYELANYEITNPLDIETLANYYYRNHNYTKAADWYKKIANTNSKFLSVIGKCYDNLDNNYRKDAILWYERFLSVSFNADVAKRFVELCKADNNDEKILCAVEKSPAQEEFSSIGQNVWKDLGDRFHEKGLFIEAARAYQLIKLPTNNIKFKTAACYYCGGKYQETQNILEAYLNTKMLHYGNVFMPEEYLKTIYPTKPIYVAIDNALVAIEPSIIKSVVPKRKSKTASIIHLKDSAPEGLPKKIKVIIDPNGKEILVNRLEFIFSLQKEIELQNAYRKKPHKTKAQYTSHPIKNISFNGEAIAELFRWLLMLVIGFLALNGAFYCAFELYVESIILWFLIVTVPLIINLLIAWEMVKTKVLAKILAVVIWILQNLININALYWYYIDGIFYFEDIVTFSWFGVIGLIVNIVACVAFVRGDKD